MSIKRFASNLLAGKSLPLNEVEVVAQLQALAEGLCKVVLPFTVDRPGQYRCRRLPSHRGSPSEAPPLEAVVLEHLSRGSHHVS